MVLTQDRLFYKVVNYKLHSRASKSTLTKSLLNPFPQDVACVKGVWTGRERIAVSKLSILSGEQSELWEECARYWPFFCRAWLSLISRVTSHDIPEWTTCSQANAHKNAMGTCLLSRARPPSLAHLSCTLLLSVSLQRLPRRRLKIW